MKTPEELNALKEDVEALNKKLAELSEEELVQVAGGKYRSLYYECEQCHKRIPEAGQTTLTIKCECGGTAHAKQCEYWK